MTPAVDFDQLRRSEFARLDATRSVYLDYTGAALYPASLVSRDSHRLATTVLGNPHSDSRPSLASTEAIETARRLTLRFLHADPAEYDVIFTANASGAMRLLAESFPFTVGSRLVLTADNHNSVNGLRMPAQRRRAEVQYVPLNSELRCRHPRRYLPAVAQPSLFAYPAQSNFSGVQHPLEWIRFAQSRGYRILLDAAAFAPTNPLSLSESPADFVAISFYKLFGYPTGVGALVARKEALATLRRTYFAGGTVQFVSVQNRLVRRKPGSEAFEDGTPNFLAMPAVCDGLAWLESLDLRRVRSRVKSLTAELLDGLDGLGESVQLYGPGNSESRGGTVAFNLCCGGLLQPFETIESRAREAGIAIRGGCFCNPGAAEYAFGIPARQARRCLRGDFTIPRFRRCLDGSPVGAIRASIGIATTHADVQRLLDFVRGVISV